MCSDRHQSVNAATSSRQDSNAASSSRQSVNTASSSRQTTNITAVILVTNNDRFTRAAARPAVRDERAATTTLRMGRGRGRGLSAGRGHARGRSYSQVATNRTPNTRYNLRPRSKQGHQHPDITKYSQCCDRSARAKILC